MNLQGKVLYGKLENLNTSVKIDDFKIEENLKLNPDIDELAFIEFCTSDII